MSADATHPTASRRTVLKGAAWSLPVIDAATAPPTAAASSPPYDSPVILAKSSWSISQNGHLRQRSAGVELVQFGQDADGTPFARSFADTIDGDVDGVAWAMVSLGALRPGATYGFTFTLRAAFATRSTSGEASDPDHRDSFRAGIRGYLEHGDEGMPVTSLYSTRAAEDPGAVQIPRVRRDGAPLTDGTWSDHASSFTVPAHWTGEVRFVWEFIRAERSAKPRKTDPAAGGPDAAVLTTPTTNDDVDVGFPVFSTAPGE